MVTSSFPFTTIASTGGKFVAELPWYSTTALKAFLNNSNTM